MNYNVTIEAIEECPEGDTEFLNSREVYWIEYYRTIQGSLTNKMTPDYLKNYENGGNRGSFGVPLTKEHKQAIKDGVVRHFRIKGHKSVYQFWVDRYGEEEADRMLGAQKKRRSVAMSGTGNHMYGRSGQDAPCYGRLGEKHPLFGTHHSDEAKKKISESTKGRPKSAATKVRMSLANHTRHHSEKKNKKCRWCLGADLQTEIDKALNEQDKDMG